MSWLFAECNTNCEKHPNNCINEQLFKTMIDLIVDDGYLELGYNTVNVGNVFR